MSDDAGYYAHTPKAEENRLAKAKLIARHLYEQAVSPATVQQLGTDERAAVLAAVDVPRASDTTWQVVVDLLRKRAAWDATQPPRPPSEPEQPHTPRHDCGCPIGPGRRITSPTRHAAWHELCVQQGGPAGEVSARALRQARGMAGGTPAGETLLDRRARDSGKRANGQLRRAARAAA